MEDTPTRKTLINKKREKELDEGYVFIYTGTLVRTKEIFKIVIKI